MVNSVKNSNLSEVSIIRPILVVLLVFYHAFAPFGGVWAPIEGYPEIKAYWWLDKLSFAFLLEMFVFISGYVCGFQVKINGDRKLSAANLIWGKFKRLMVPCIVFSFLYIILFQSINQPIYKTAYDLVNGVGHMWFLPMLYWCFIGVWAVEKLHINPKWALLLFAICSVFSFLSLPLRLGGAMYYMPFFFLGYLIQRFDIRLERFYTLKHSVLLAIAFCVLFTTLTLLREQFFVRGGTIIGFKVVRLVLLKLMQIIYSLCGLMMTFCIVGYTERIMKRSTPQWLLNVGSLCFGVYLLQQFVLVGLYEYTNLPNIAGCYWLPWIGFIITLLCSVSLSALLVKTRIGCFLIG